ncbi:MAG: hypothetical protein PHT07_03990 [Paludibacter sp.]|nr:hypothetical protein [Paludibacter sp.]
MKREKLEKLASEKNSPCVTISMNTHRNYTENQKDMVVLRNLVIDAKERVLKEYGKRSVNGLFEKLDQLENEMDVEFNLDSIHLFVSNSTKEIIKSTWPVMQNTVQVSETFAVKPLIKAFNRSVEYLILKLTQSEVRLLMAMNDGIVGEVKNDDFPFVNNVDETTDSETVTNGKQAENLVKEFFNKIDKALVKETNKTNMKCVVICTDDNYSRLMKVADKPSVYLGWTNINYNNTVTHSIANDAWQVVNVYQKKGRAEDIKEMQEAVNKGNVLTDLSEIYQAAKEGRGDLLIVNDHFHQAVRVTGDFSLDLVKDASLPGVISDITSDIAWDVISKKGRAIFTTQEELKTLGDIALKVRY